MKYFMTLLLACVALTGNSQKVKLVNDEANRKVDVMIGGKLMTSFMYPANQEKPFLKLIAIMATHLHNDHFDETLISQMSKKIRSSKIIMGKQPSEKLIICHIGLS